MDSRFMFRGQRGERAGSRELWRWAARERRRTRNLGPNDEWSWVRAGVLCVCSAILAGCFAAPAHAHKVILFAAVQGRTVTGEVYYQGGSPARDVTVTVTTPDGETLGTLTTDADGKFIYRPDARQSLHIIADAGMGHHAEYVVRKEELPQDLPESRAAGNADTKSDAADDARIPAATSGHGHDPNGAVHTHEHEATAHSHDPAELGHAHRSDEVGHAAVEQQVAALRRDLDRWRARLRLQDILGGIGYILGIFGLWAYVVARRRSTQ